MALNNYLFTSESVSSGHPDKLADQISDLILDRFLEQDKDSKVACETFITDGLVLVGGEVHSTAYVDIKKAAYDVLSKVGYNTESGFDPRSFGLISAIHEQSTDIRMGVEREREEMQGAGDQGMMFGYACNETKQYMPATMVLANSTLQILERLRKKGNCIPLYPDAKCQYTIEYRNNKPYRIDKILVSTQHAPTVTREAIESLIANSVIPLVKKENKELEYLFKGDAILMVNPTGQFVIGGPKGDTGLTGRKIIVDTYGGKCPHGGGAFSGKDSSKVDRSAAYMARYLAKNIVASGIADEAIIQLSYAIGVAQPLSVYVNTNGTAKGCSDEDIAKIIIDNFDLTPSGIIKKFGLKNPIYYPTSTYGHFGRKPYIENGIQFFGWEVIDSAQLFKTKKSKD